MHLLVTAGNTQTPLDQVRCITNIFTGQTGARIARAARDRGHQVRLLTSHPETACGGDARPSSGGLEISPYRTFDDLQRLLREDIVSGRYDALVHCAAVSDFQLAGAFAPAPAADFDATTGRWNGPDSGPHLVEAAAGKIKSHLPELWLRLVPTPKLVDSIRAPWGFRGVLVKFKLEVGVSDDELCRIARVSREQSDADLVVANTLAGMHDWAFLIDRSGTATRLARSELPAKLVTEIESRQPR